MLIGRLGLEGAEIPQADRHGNLWLRRGNLYVENGTLRFRAAPGGDFPSGDYAIPFQTLSALLLEPGTTCTHDALRLVASHGTAVAIIGQGGVRNYAIVAPHGPDHSARARRHVTLWADPEKRIAIVRKMYARRLGEVVPRGEISILRGIEGSRIKRLYKELAAQYNVTWRRRELHRDDPESADLPNQAINHVATGMYALAEVATALTGAIPQLGFIHEDSSRSFPLDIADLYRETVTVPIAFQAVHAFLDKKDSTLDKSARRLLGQEIRRTKLVVSMIDLIKEYLDGDDDDHHA